jgi:hypothetical protein
MGGEGRCQRAGGAGRQSAWRGISAGTDLAGVGSFVRTDAVRAEANILLLEPSSSSSIHPVRGRVRCTEGFGRGRWRPPAPSGARAAARESYPTEATRSRRCAPPSPPHPNLLEGAPARRFLPRGARRRQRAYAPRGARRRELAHPVAHRAGSASTHTGSIDSTPSAPTRVVVESAASNEPWTPSLIRKRSLGFPPSLFNK